jgi:hypothetical protein
MNATIVQKNSGKAAVWECECGAVMTCMPDGTLAVERCKVCGTEYQVGVDCAVAAFSKGTGSVADRKPAPKAKK